MPRVTVTTAGETATVDYAPVGAVPAPEAGAWRLGDVDYPPPAGALFVAPNGSDVYGTGKETAPYATLKKAVAVAQAGACIVLREGEYRERVGDITKAVTIRPCRREKVWFDGSDVVTGWTRNTDGTWSANFTATFDHSESFQQGVTYTNSSGTERFVDKTNYPLAAWPDMVFIDGVRQRKVTGTPGPGQFKITTSTQTEWQHTTAKYTIGTDPTGKEVRAAKRELWAVVKAACDIRGIGIRRYATSLYMQGTINVVQAGAGTVLDNCWVIDSATEGVSANGKGTKVTNCSIIRAGMNAIQGNRCESVVIEGNWLDEANWEWFNTAPAAGALKFNRAALARVNWNAITNAHRSGGIWLDTSCYGAQIVGNDLRGNDGTPIWVEAGENVMVANNHTSSGGAGYGIGVWISGNVRVFNNTVADTMNWGIGLCTDSRRNTDPATKDLAPWICRDNTVANNVFGPVRRWFQFYGFDGVDGANLPGLVRAKLVSGNVFRTGAVAEPNARRIGWDKPATMFSDPLAWAAAIGRPAWVNRVSDGDPSAFDSDAVPVPADIAAVMGVPAGTRQVGPIVPPPVVRALVP